MAVATQGDFVIYEDEFYTGQFEVNQQMVDVFNEASRGAIRLMPRIHEGNKTAQAFFQKITNLTSRRDPTSTGSKASKKLTSDDNNWPKVFGTIGPIENTLNSLKAIASDDQEFSFILGQMAQRDKLADMLNMGLKAFVTAVETGTDGTNYIIDTSAVINYDKVIDLNTLFGDKSDRLITYLGHSEQISSLTKKSLDVQDNVAGRTLAGQAPPAMGRALLRSDASDLKDPTGAGSSPDVASYKLCALTEGAITIEESEEDELVSEMVTGNDNLSIRIQGEYTFTIKLKGYDYTGSTPVTADSDISTAGNWNMTANDFKDTAGAFYESK